MRGAGSLHAYLHVCTRAGMSPPWHACTGVNAVNFYAQTVITDAGFSKSKAFFFSIFIGVIKVGWDRYWQPVLATGVGNRCWQQVLATTWCMAIVS